jgi:hypothetical protein
MIICIIAYLLIPTIADATGQISMVTFDEFNSSGSRQLRAPGIYIEGVKDIYIPPNYGGPDSRHGSGTR